MGRVACPLNCHDSCAQITTVTDGLLRKVEGDADHPLTGGRLCAKGYAYVDRTYAADRLRHPLIQSPRGSGQWRRASWDEALDRIADKLLELDRRYGSLLPVCLYTGTANLSGTLHHKAPEGLFRSMGPYTETVNTLCWTVGHDAMVYDFGALQTNDPREMLNARTILVWGTNPAWTAVHQMHLIMEARDRGATVVVIDPVVSATASRADQHLQVRPAADGALALGMARYILDAGLCNEEFISQHVHGWEAFADYLRRDVTVEWAASVTGLTPAQIEQTARLYATNGPATIWVGLGMQRYANSGQAVRAVNALAAMTGQIGRSGTGVQYVESRTRMFGQYTTSFRPPAGRPPYEGPGGRNGNRQVSASEFARTVRALNEPPVRMCWIAGSNPAAQAPDSGSVVSLLREMELVVVVDQFMTRTAEVADILLPTTTYFERWDLVYSAWNQYVSLNEQVIAPLFESRSDLQIAWALSQKLHERAPGFCTFPREGDERSWLDAEWNDRARALLGARGPAALASGPIRTNLPRIAWESLQFSTPSGRIELCSDTARAQGLPAMGIFTPPLTAPAEFPIRLLTPRPAESHNSQFHAQPWVMRVTARPVVEMHPDMAACLELQEGDLARIANRGGELHLPVRLTRTVPMGVVLAYTANYHDQRYPLNDLVEAVPADMGGLGGFPGAAFSDTFVTVEPSCKGGRR